MAAVRPARLERRTRQAVWRRLPVALALAVIAGVLGMHGFSLGHDAPTHREVVTAGHQSHSDRVDPQASTATTDGADDRVLTGNGCTDHACDAAFATLCVFVLLTLASLLPRRAGSPWRTRPPWSAVLRAPPLLTGGDTRVSLARLCISRT